MITVALALTFTLAVPGTSAAGSTARRPLPSVIDARLTAAAEALTRGVDPLTLRAPVGAVAPAAPDHPPGSPGRQAPTHLPGARRPLPGGALRPFVRPDGRLQVQVRVEPGGEVAAVAEALRAQGVEVQRLRPAEGLLQALVAPEGLEALAADPRVAAVRPPHYAYPQVGRVVTEGDAVPGGSAPGAVNAAQARAGLGAGGYSARLGRRIRIGVVSDGVAGLGRSQLSGDLPVELTARSFIDTGSLVRNSGGVVVAEGRALLEILHDLVPDARLFVAVVETDLDYLDAVTWLRDEAQVDVIVDDIAFFNAGPYDGTSDVARIRTGAVADGVAYVAAVGNFGRAHHASRFEPGPPGSGTAGAVAHRFPSSTFRLPVVVEAGAQAIVFLQWDDRPFERAESNFDLLAFPSAADGGEPVDESFDQQAGEPGQTPTEAVVLDNTGASGATTFGIQVEFCGRVTAEGACDPGGSLPDRTFEVFVVGGSIPAGNGNLVRAGSIPNGPDAASIITVGAVDVSSGALEPFSSLGPAPGDPRFDPDDVKPTVVGPDGVSTTVSEVSGLGGNGRFFGTSAAAPHVGAIAAMLIALQPDLVPNRTTDPEGTDLRRRLARGAIQFGGQETPNTETGFGRADAVCAVEGAPGLVSSASGPGTVILAVGLTTAGLAALGLLIPGAVAVSLTTVGRAGRTAGLRRSGLLLAVALLAAACGGDGNGEPAAGADGSCKPAGRGLVEVDPAFTLAPGAPMGDVTVVPSATGVALVTFVLTNSGTAPVTVVAVTATARVGGNSVTLADPGTSGHERADLARVRLIRDGETLGSGRFTADDGRLLVLLDSPLTLASGASSTFELAYDLDVKPRGTTVFSRGEVEQSSTCPAPADPLDASECLDAEQARFTLRPLGAGDIIALRSTGTPAFLDDQPVAPAQTGAIAARTVTVLRP